jgi:DNA-directed RNA polymerase subunit RPC12/RpoP
VQLFECPECERRYHSAIGSNADSNGGWRCPNCSHELKFVDHIDGRGATGEDGWPHIEPGWPPRSGR